MRPNNKKMAAKAAKQKATKKITFGFFDAKRISISGSLESKKLNKKKSMMSSDYDNGSI